MPVTRTVPSRDPGALRQRARWPAVDAIVVASPRAARAGARATRSRARDAAEPCGRSARRRGARSTIAEIAGAACRRACATAPSSRGALVASARLRASACSCRAPRRAAPRRSRSCVPRAPRSIDVDRVSHGARAGRRSRARARPRAARGGEAAVCCVFAPSQVAALAQLVGRSPPLRDPVLRDRRDHGGGAARGRASRDVAVAAAPTPEGMAQAVRSVYPAGHELPRLPAAPDAAHREPPPDGPRDAAGAPTTSSIRCSSCRAPASRSRSARCRASSTTRSTRRSTPRAARRRPRHPGRDPVRHPRAQGRGRLARRGRTPASSRRRSARSRRRAPSWS